MIDCSGTWHAPNPAGSHGMPAPGETRLADRIAYGIPDVLGVERATYAAACGAMVVVAVFIGGAPRGPAVRRPAIPLGRTLRAALAHPGFVAMAIAFFACGFQLMFITTHLPRFLGLCGLAPAVGAQALAVIGVCNAFGSYAFGRLGQSYSPKRLLAAIYAIRTLAILAYLAAPVSAAGTLIFAAVMGATWLGVVPLVSALIGRLFGLERFNMLFGVVCRSSTAISAGCVSRPPERRSCARRWRRCLSARRRRPAPKSARAGGGSVLPGGRRPRRQTKGGARTSDRGC